MRRSTQSGRRVFGLTHRKSRKNVPSISTPLRGCKWRSGCKLLKLHGSVSPPWTPCPLYAIDAEIPKLDVAGSNPVSRHVKQMATTRARSSNWVGFRLLVAERQFRKVIGQDRKSVRVGKECR